MEADWTRHYPWLDLSGAELERRLASRLGAVQVLGHEPLSEGRRTTAYRVWLRGYDAPCVLRFCVAEASTAAREAAILRLVQGSVPAPEVLALDESSEPPWTLLTWLPGERLDRALHTASPTARVELATAAGHVLAQIHRFRFPATGWLNAQLTMDRPLELDGDGWASALDGFLSQPAVHDSLGPSLSQRLHAIIPIYARRLDPLAADARLVHADYQPTNLLVQRQGGRWAVSGVLDWEFALAATPLLDVAVFLRHASSYGAGYEESFVAGYRAGGGALPPDWRSQTYLLDLLNLCSLLAQPGGGAGRAATVQSWVERILAELA